jgi:hypothetical protein
MLIAQRSSLASLAHVAFALLVASALSTLGCASLLGDFQTTDDGVDASVEGGDAQAEATAPDVTVPRGDAEVDAPPEGDARTDCSPRDTAACAEDQTGAPIPGFPASPAGICKTGVKTCASNGTWGPCVGAVGPRARDCEYAADGNCDGQPDDTIDAVCECNAAHSTRTINGVPPSNCQCTETCGADHRWVVCTPPAACDCTPNDTRACTGASGCAGGTQTCGSDRKWGSCNGAPAKATYCLDHDADSYCAATTACATVCPGALPAEWKVNCPTTDCDDNNAASNPKAPPACKPTNDCHSGTLGCAATGSACTDTGASLPGGTACGAGGVCSQGTCGACVAGSARCTATSPQTPQTCPAGQWVSGTACSVNATCTATATAATCACKTGYVGNGVTCCAPESDAAFCGRVSRTCGAASGNDNCGTPRNVASCGACSNGNACTTAGACGCNGASACQGTKTCCAGGCVDTTTDPGNCSACGKSCGAGSWQCTNATCACEQVCSGVCKFLADTSNCGKCGNVCGTGTTCCTDASGSPWTCRAPGPTCLQ